eukprot:112858_1
MSIPTAQPTVSPTLKPTHKPTTPPTPRPTDHVQSTCGDTTDGSYNGEPVTFVVHIPYRGDLQFNAASSSFTVTDIEAFTNLNVPLASDVNNDEIVTLYDIPAGDYKFLIAGDYNLTGTTGVFEVRITCTSPNPTNHPSNRPTLFPSGMPSSSPSYSPTKKPTLSPNKLPTLKPSRVPTSAPTKFPTSHPSKRPSGVPTSLPTKGPTSSPTKVPTLLPSQVPIRAPTSLHITSHPSFAPSATSSSYTTKTSNVDGEADGDSRVVRIDLSIPFLNDLGIGLYVTIGALLCCCCGGVAVFVCWKALKSKKSKPETEMISIQAGNAHQVVRVQSPHDQILQQAMDFQRKKIELQGSGFKIGDGMDGNEPAPLPPPPSNTTRCVVNLELQSSGLVGTRRDSYSDSDSVFGVTHGVGTRDELYNQNTDELVRTVEGVDSVNHVDYVVIKEVLMESNTTNWQEYFGNFIRHQVTDEVLKGFSREHENWNVLIPQIVARVKFQNAWFEYMSRVFQYNTNNAKV